MRLAKLNLVNFRNIETARLDFEGRRTFFLGANGQGKTNLLEAIGFSFALRSFRTSEVRDLIRWEQPRTELLYRFEDASGNEIETHVTFNQTAAKEVFIDGEKVVRLGDFIGRFPSVVFCSEDLRLPRGSPSERRRFLDLVFSSSEAEYLEALRRYHRALRGRNSLLRNNGTDTELAAFETEMSSAAVVLGERRREGILELGDHFGERYHRISGSSEESSLRYLPDAEITEIDDFARFLRDGRQRDRLAKATQRGPHRDDFAFVLNDRDVRKFASEGQQRSTVLALRFGQADFLLQRQGVRPLILADDVLGELDSGRQSNFCSCLDDEFQVFATGTKPYLDGTEAWETFETEEGRFTKA